MKRIYDFNNILKELKGGADPMDIGQAFADSLNNSIEVFNQTEKLKNQAIKVLTTAWMNCLDIYTKDLPDSQGILERARLTFTEEYWKNIFLEEVVLAGKIAADKAIETSTEDKSSHTTKCSCKKKIVVQKADSDESIIGDFLSDLQ